MPYKGFNSKGFLILYLVVITALIVVWLSRQDVAQVDNRDIPQALAPHIVSPPQSVPQFLLNSKGKQVLTNSAFLKSWTFVYFIHSGCQPECDAVLRVMHNLQRFSASRDMRFVLIDFDASNTALPNYPTDISVYTAGQQQLDDLAQTFDFLFLRTQYVDGYSIEQQHDIFLVDPKGRIYARFVPPFTSLTIQQQFIALRDFYARSE